MAYIATDKRIITTEKGKRCLVYEGFIYHLDRSTTDNLTTWRCEQNKTTKCKGRLRQIGDNMNTIIEHNHAPNHDRAEGRIAKSGMYAQATVTGLPARTVWNTTTATTSAGGIMNVPNITSFSRSMSRKRKINYLPYPIPQTLADINLPSELMNTMRGERFLLHDSGPHDSERIFVFATDDNLVALQSCQYIFADETFKIVSALFEQLWTIHGTAHMYYLVFNYIT
jgi:hypothetical protein